MRLSLTAWVEPSWVVTAPPGSTPLVHFCTLPLPFVYDCLVTTPLIPPTPSEPSPFDLGHEIGQIQGGISTLLERTADLPELRTKVNRHESELSLLKWVGGTAVAGAMTAAWAAFKAKFGAH